MKLKKFFRFLLNFFFWTFVVGIASLAVLILIYGNDLPDYKKLATYAPPVATRLYAADGSLLIEYAEERRLFYVALTRTKSIVYLLSEKSKSSEFIQEIKSKCYIMEDESEGCDIYSRSDAVEREPHTHTV